MPTATIPPTPDRLLTPELSRLLDELTARFGERRNALLADRSARRQAFREGDVARSESTAHVREARWVIDPVPVELLERRVELLGAPTRSAIIEGMNAGAKSYIADLWNMALTDEENILRAHKNLERAVENRLAYVGIDGDRHRIDPNSTTRLMVVPRPLHAEHLIDGRSVPACFVDLCLLTLHCGPQLRLRQGGIYLYLRGIQGHLEARLWKDLFEVLEEHAELPRGTIRATVFIDNLAAALEADEILFELMHHAAGLSLDPQSYATDHIDLFSAPDRAVLPDRERIGLNAGFLRSVSLMAIATAHRRQAHAMGAPSFILPPGVSGRQQAGYLDMIADKEREAVDGHDGTLVAHPGLVTTAMAEFNKSMPRAHQMYYERKDHIEPSDLVRRPEGPLSTESLINAVRTVLRALVFRTEGVSLVQQGGRQHDRSSVHLSAALLWSWVQSSHGVITDTGLEIHTDLVRYLIKKEADKLVQGSPQLRPAADRAIERLNAMIVGTTMPADPLA